MTMDEKYFVMKQGEIKFNSSDAIELAILKQIARDAAEQQRKQCVPYCEYKTKRGCVNCPEEMEIPE